MKKLILLVFLTIKIVLSVEYTINGVLKSFYAVQIGGEHEFFIEYNRFQLNTEAYTENLHGLFVVDFLHDLNKQSEVISLREAWVEYFSSWFSLKLGRQHVVWGKVDGYFVNDIVNPLDLSYFLLQDFNDIRTPVNILRGKIYRDNSGFEIIAIPEFKNSVLPSTGRWSIFSIQFPPAFQGFKIMDKKVENNLANVGLGGRFSTFLFGTDLSLVFLRKMEYTPIMKISMEDSLIMKTYRWFTFYGFGFSQPFGAIVLRGEGGYYKQRHFSTIDLTSVKSPFYQYCVGFDYELLMNLNISMQYIEERIADYNPKIIQEERRCIFTTFLNYKSANETIKPALILLYNIEDESLMSGLNLELDMIDNLNIVVGGFIFNGNRDSFFGRFDSNDLLFLKVKYYF